MYATVVKKNPPTIITAATTMKLRWSRETNKEAVAPLVIHVDTKAVMTRFEVTSSRYRR